MVEESIMHYCSKNISRLAFYRVENLVGSMRTGASSGAETIRVNGEVLEYQIQGNQRCYCAVHVRDNAVCRMKYAKYAVREYASSLIKEHVCHKPCGPETEAHAENAHMKQEAGHSLCLNWLNLDKRD